MHFRTLVLLAAVCATGAWGPARAADDARIPNLAPDSVTGWLKPPGDEFIQPDSGPGPVRADPAHPYVPNSFPYVPRAAAAQQTGMERGAALSDRSSTGGGAAARNGLR
jgi:hypothetical protein